MGGQLRRVIFSLSPEWKEEEEELRKRLMREGILCTGFLEAELLCMKMDSDTVVLTDSPQTGVKLAREGIVYFGCCHVRSNQRNPGRWFDGAALVLEGFEEVDAEYLEEWMFRAKGQPAVIARTGRLLIREIANEDIPELERIGRQGCGINFTEEKTAYGKTRHINTEKTSCIEEGTLKKENLPVQGNRFTKEYLYPYRRTAYRLQGFGLWSVLYQDRVIGCCGFAPWDAEADTAESVMPRITSGQQVDMIQNRADKILHYHLTFREPAGLREPAGFRKSDSSTSGYVLEMQYMLDDAYHRQGFGTEMCRAVLRYARERLEADEVRLRIWESNTASLALAEKLGFIPLIPV